MIKKISQIKSLIDAGELDSAEKALDLILEFGPTNLKALKLKALIFSQKGLFSKEYDLWCKIVSLDFEDQDAARYFELYYLEEREKFYFTDLVPEGGRRFLLHPRALLESCGSGFISCLAFLLLSQYSSYYYFLKLPFISIFLFLLFVILPWFFIIHSYVTMPGDVWITSKKFMITSRFKQLSLNWGDIEGVYVVHKLRKHSFALSVLIVPNDKEKEVIEVDISSDNSIVKARRFFLTEILSFYDKVEYISQEKVKTPHSKSIIF